MKYYVVVAEWCVDYQAGHRVVGVYTSETDAVAALDKRVSSDDRLLAEEYGYKIYEDNKTCFDAGIDGYYIQDHLYVGIEEVDMNSQNQV